MEGAGDSNGHGGEPDDERRVGLREMRTIGLGAVESTLRFDEVRDLIVPQAGVELPREEAGEQDGNEAKDGETSGFGYPKIHVPLKWGGSEIQLSGLGGRHRSWELKTAAADNETMPQRTDDCVETIRAC